MIFYVDDFPGRHIVNSGKTYAYFGGTAYLGLQTDESFRELLISNIIKYGTNYSASRKSNIRFSIYEKAEAALARFVGSEACVTFSSGYLTGQLLCSYFKQPTYKSFYAPATHSALHQQDTENYSSYEALQQAVETHIKVMPSTIPVLYFDTIDFQGYHYPDFTWLNALPLEKIILVADDSHGFGITGLKGEGSYRILKKLNSKSLVVCGSLGKGFGIQAGGIFCDASLMRCIMETDIFSAASPAAPYFMATWLQAQDIYIQKRQILLRNIQEFHDNINDLSLFQYLKDYPTFSYSDEALSIHLMHHHIMVTNFKYPNDNADTVSRIVLSAHHTNKDMLHLINAINLYPTKLLC